MRPWTSGSGATAGDSGATIGERKCVIARSRKPEPGARRDGDKPDTRVLFARGMALKRSLLLQRWFPIGLDWTPRAPLIAI